jgi:hypothetical protein
MGGFEMDIEDFAIIELFILKNFDGADGSMSRASGMITDNEDFAKTWSKKTMGYYEKVGGVMVRRMEDMEVATKQNDRRKALAKLTPAEQKLLGFA